MTTMLETDLNKTNIDMTHELKSSNTEWMVIVLKQSLLPRDFVPLDNDCVCVQENNLLSLKRFLYEEWMCNLTRLLKEIILIFTQNIEKCWKDEI